MNFKTTCILLVLLAAVGTYLFLTRDNGAATTTTEVTDGKKLLTIAAADMQSITVSPAEGKPFTFVRDGTLWKISKPIDSAAESGLVQAMADELANLISLNQTDVTDGTGLKSPRFVVDLTTRDGKTTTVNVGEKSSIGDRLYVQVKGAKKADVVTSGLEEQLDKPLDEFRQKKMIALAGPEIRYVAIDRPGGKLEMVKSNEAWKVISPEAMPADPSAVGELVMSIASLRAVEFVQDADASKLGLGDDAKTITISSAAPASATSQPTTVPTSQPALIKIRIGRPDTVLQRNLYATIVGSNVIVKVPKESLNFLDRKAIEFRDKMVTTVDPALVNKLAVTVDRPATTQPTTKPAEKKTVAVTRRPPPATQPTTTPSTQPIKEPQLSTWMAADPLPAASVSPLVNLYSANDSMVESILAAFHPLRAEKYVEAAPTSGTTIVVTIHSGGVGAFPKDVTMLQIIDPGDAKPPVATYNGLHFEIERTLLEKLEADFNKPGPPPAAARPEPGPEMRE